jgi:hypothetical protein
MKEGEGKPHWARAAARLQAIDRELGRLEVPYEEWEVLFRTKLLLERELLRNIANFSEETRHLIDGSIQPVGARLLEDPTEREIGLAKSGVMGIIAGASIGAIAGLLLAPKPGKDARQMLQGQASVLKDRVSQYAMESRNGTGAKSP